MLDPTIAPAVSNLEAGCQGFMIDQAIELLVALDRPEWTEYTEVIISEVDRLQSLTSNMLVPGSRLQKKAVNILEVLEHIRRIILAAEPDRIRIARDYDPSIPEFMADHDMLIQAFLNLVRNAVQAIDGEGLVTLKTRVDYRYTIGQITHPLVLRVDISDTGRGIPREMGETIFLPMITSKADGSGLGLLLRASNVANKLSFGLLGKTQNQFGRLFEALTGHRLMLDLSQFFDTFSGVIDGFRRRALGLSARYGPRR